MIPTVLKTKLPRDLCYPVGAQQVSLALASVPQFNELKLWFSWYRHKTAKKEEMGPVFVARYNRYHLGLSASHYLEESGFYDPKWEVQVHAIPKLLNAAVRAALFDHGFETVCQWFSEKHSELWFATSHECRLYYSQAEDRLIANSIDR